MYVSRLSDILITLCLFWQILVILASNNSANYSPPDSIAISCGSSGELTAPDGRVWIGDSGSESSSSPKINGKPSKSRAIHQPDSVPYKTARVSHPGPYTFLSNFSAADVLGSKQMIREYCVNIDNGGSLTITFSPAQRKRKSDNFYAFVNGIEVVSMPTSLYFTPEGELGAPVVGQKYRFYIDNSTALELVQRLNVGGTSISPAEDSSMFRRWDQDSDYLLETGDDPAANVVTMRYTGTSTCIAPNKVYQTARSIYADTKLSENNLTWKIPVDLGFRYLIRLHCYEFQPKIAEAGKKEFSVVINNQIAEENSDVIQWGGTNGVAVYRDYIVMMEGDKMAGKRHLTITFQPNFESRDKHFHGSLNGLEVFKLSNPDNNLAGSWSVPELRSPTSTPRRKKPLSVYTTDLIATVLICTLTLLNIAVYYLRRVSDSNSGLTNIRSSPSEHRCRQFSIDEIRTSTNNFDPRFHIGSGGYGRVYKGSFDRELHLLQSSD
ncbi:UNVERIFIED_CONTAM: Receptor-like protein kinase FERONIA [Sesamum radiatum]|uniref:Receptor-like protein kinase FERONIA n=1 Tax=Sesamum radiatum TaxID=300843 RepID=A0AAW2P4M9_SESRA